MANSAHWPGPLRSTAIITLCILPTCLSTPRRYLLHVVTDSVARSVCAQPLVHIFVCALYGVCLMCLSRKSRPARCLFRRIKAIHKKQVPMQYDFTIPRLVDIMFRGLGGSVEHEVKFTSNHGWLHASSMSPTRLPSIISLVSLYKTSNDITMALGLSCSRVCIHLFPN